MKAIMTKRKGHLKNKVSAVSGKVTKKRKVLSEL